MNVCKNIWYPVLDQGWVRLVDQMGDDSSVTEAARTSYSNTKKSSDRDLLRYLYRHRHTSPFEMVELKFHIKLPIFVARQMVRHRTASLNEMSGRYVEVPQEFYVPPAQQVCQQSQNNKQGRGEPLTDKAVDVYLGGLESSRRKVSESYQSLLDQGVAKELARIDLPLSTYTQWYWKTDLHNLLNFLSLRYDPHAQWETREYARIIGGILHQTCPVSLESWIDYRHCARQFSRQELSLLLDTPHNAGPEDASRLGMTTREYDEYLEKVSSVPEPPDFSLPEPIPCPRP